MAPADASAPAAPSAAGRTASLPTSLTVRAAITIAGALTLLVGVWIKVHFAHGSVRVGPHLPGYSDIVRLYHVRGLQLDRFPYVDAHLHFRKSHDGFLEYPVLTGVFVWLTSLVSSSDDQFFAYTAAALVPLGVATTWMLARMYGARALVWALSPSLLLFGLLNWDLLPVAAFVAALVLRARGRHAASAVMIGVGGALKLYPLLFVPALALERLHAQGRAAAARFVAISVGTFAAINLPVYLASPSGWMTTWTFQSLRPADGASASLWWYLPDLRMPPELVSRLDLTLVVTLGAVFALIGWLRRDRVARAYPALQVCAATLAVFLLVNKAFSPQYALWLLPFFVVLRVPLRYWVVLEMADVVLYWGFFAVGSYSNELFAGGYETVGVVLRAAVLVCLIPVFLRAAPARRSDGAALLTAVTRRAWEHLSRPHVRRAALTSIGMAALVVVPVIAVASSAVPHATLVRRCATKMAHDPRFANKPVFSGDPRQAHVDALRPREILRRCQAAEASGDVLDDGTVPTQ